MESLNIVVVVGVVVVVMTTSGSSVSEYLRVNRYRDKRSV
jgi:hypothetical protein